MSILDIKEPIHLDRQGIIETGSFYTPRYLIDEVASMIKPFLAGKRSVILFDNSVGGGAFTQIMDGYDYRLADTDKTCCDLLAAFTDPERVFHSNSLLEVSREKYNIPENAYLVQVGNPPYNDTTSAYKKGEKGANFCDKDLFDRDLGVSFLKSYDKLKSDLVCVLHPLAYLVKEANFKRLRGFRENYTLRDAVIFSSSCFPGTGTGKFPIIIGLYEKTKAGMEFKTIQEFPFRLLGGDCTGYSHPSYRVRSGEEQIFRLSRFTTTDGYISKYPARKNDLKESALGLYFYTFRDTNSLKRSASFQSKPHYNAIVVNLENFYHYAYLFAFRTLFEPVNRWLYGNLSPLVDIEYLEAHRSDFVAYALARHPIFKEIAPEIIQRIEAFYGIKSPMDESKVQAIESEFRRFFDSLIKG